MATKRHRLVVERLEQRNLLAASVWFEDSGQALGTNTYGVEFGDVDADGDLDAFLANGHRGNVPDRVWLNDGKGKFTDSGQRLGRSHGNRVELGDLDGDGDLDAVVANGAIFEGSVVEQPNEVWLNDGSGVFTAAQKLGDATTNEVALGDIDNDGDLDALFANLGQDNQVWFNTQPIAGDANRDGVFNSSDLIQTFQAGQYEDNIPGNSTWSEGDWNGDGDFDTADLVLAFQCGCYEATSPARSVFDAATHHRESLVATPRKLTSDMREQTLDARIVDRLFE